MSELIKVSREQLFEESNAETAHSSPVILPRLEFEIVENAEALDAADSKEADEFDFPLFSASKIDTGEGAIKISLKEPTPEIVIQERPSGYYFTQYSEREKAQFHDAAITPEQVIRTYHINSYPNAKVINLVEYNSKIERQLLKERRERTRPGKKKRLARIEGKKRSKERKLADELAEKQRRKFLKKKFHRGGRKHKKPQSSNHKPPVFRTE